MLESGQGPSYCALLGKEFSNIVGTFRHFCNSIRSRRVDVLFGTCMQSELKRIDAFAARSIPYRYGIFMPPTWAFPRLSQPARQAYGPVRAVTPGRRI